MIQTVVLTAIIGATFTACNDDESDPVYVLSSSTTVRSFNLSADKKLLPHLDSVFFSIDLYSRQIFNADSLPYGTKVDKLVPVVKVESASAIEFIVTKENGTDTTYNYIEHSSDSISFVNPVKLRVVSVDGLYESVYTVRVNVHQVKTDSLVWQNLASGQLPTLLDGVTTQHTTVTPAGIFYCLTEYNGEYCMASTTDPSSDWQAKKIRFDFTPDVNNFVAGDETFYILDVDGNLYESQTSDYVWQSSGVKAKSIIGLYNNNVITTSQTGTDWTLQQYPAGITTSAPTDFPVMNTSTPTLVTFEMSTNPQMIITGGRKADGQLTNASWGFDGNSWVKVSRTGLPAAIENMSLAPYYQYEVDSVSWKPKEPRNILLAMFGNDEKGVLNDQTYMSVNYGLTWDTVPDFMQLPATLVPLRTNAQIYCYTHTNTTALTTKAPGKRNLQIVWQNLIEETKKPKSRINNLDEQWEVPYLYMFGGTNGAGTTYNTVYRGVITAFTFAPLQ